MLRMMYSSMCDIAARRRRGADAVEEDAEDGVGLHGRSRGGEGDGEG